MVYFVLDDPGGEIHQLLFLGFSLVVGVLQDNFLGARDIQPDSGEAQTTFLVDVCFFALPCDFGIDQRRDLPFDHRKAQPNRLADLRCCEADTIRLGHRFCHVFDQFQDVLRDLGDLLGLGAKNGVILADENGKNGHDAGGGVLGRWGTGKLEK